MRKFKVPTKIKFKATEYFEMINCIDVVMMETSVIKTMTDAVSGNSLQCQ